jgi:hypothetical protein
VAKCDCCKEIQGTEQQLDPLDPEVENFSEL